jgi:HSP20 family molecular chaperone IbpA
MDRRKFISASAVFLTTGCLGGDESHEPQESELEPIDLVVSNIDRGNTTVSVEITQDDETVYSDELDVTQDGRLRVQSVIQEEGEYVVRAELNGMDETENVRISSSSRTVEIHFGNERIQIGTSVNGG